MKIGMKNGHFSPYKLKLWIKRKRDTLYNELIELTSKPRDLRSLDRFDHMVLYTKTTYFQSDLTPKLFPIKNSLSSNPQDVIFILRIIIFIPYFLNKRIINEVC